MFLVFWGASGVLGALLVDEYSGIAESKTGDSDLFRRIGLYAVGFFFGGIFLLCGILAMIGEKIEGDD